MLYSCSAAESGWRHGAAPSQPSAHLWTSERSSQASSLVARTPEGTHTPRSLPSLTLAPFTCFPLPYPRLIHLSLPVARYSHPLPKQSPLAVPPEEVPRGRKKFACPLKRGRTDRYSSASACEGEDSTRGWRRRPRACLASTVNVWSTLHSDKQGGRSEKQKRDHVRGAPSNDSWRTYKHEVLFLRGWGGVVSTISNFWSV